KSTTGPCSTGSPTSTASRSTPSTCAATSATTAPTPTRTSRRPPPSTPPTATARWTSSPQCRTPCRGWDSTPTTSTKPTTGSSPRQVPSEALPARPDPRRGRCRRHLGGHRAPRLDRPHRHHDRGPRLVRRVHPRRPHLTTAQQKRPAGRIGGAPNPSIPGEHHMVLHHSVGITYGIELPADTDTEAIERACFGQPDSPDSVGYIVIGDRDRLILATRYTPAE